MILPECMRGFEEKVEDGMKFAELADPKVKIRVIM